MAFKFEHAQADDRLRMSEVLCLIAHFSPGFKAGGALRSVENIAAALAKRCKISILTSDRDLGDVEAYPGISANRWTRRGDVEVYYSDRSLSSIFRVLKDSEAGTVYLNSFFDARFSILPLLWLRLFSLDRRIILAPRGEFSTGALRLKSLKKRAFIALAKRLGLYSSVHWHVSTTVERDELRRVIPVADDKIHVVRDLVATREVAGSSGATQLPLRACFVSRISPKKNLLYAIEAVIAAERPIILDIYGPEEDRAYADLCRAAAARASTSQAKIAFHGSVAHDRVQALFSDYALFVFPTLGENFGHVIAEALASGTPVLISDQTPWRSLNEHGIGWDLPLSQPHRFAEAIRTVTDMAGADYNLMRERAAAYRFGISDEVAKDEMFRLFFPPQVQTRSP